MTRAESGLVGATAATEVATKTSSEAGVTVEEIMGEMGDGIDDKQLKEPAVLTDWQLPFAVAP
jgi:hypothetical protein